MSRLLILACSKQKRPNGEPLPAVERYDGPSFRVLRKYRRERGTDDPHTLILSGRYGLIQEDHEIPSYDEQLTKKEAERIRPRVLQSLADVESTRGPFDDGLICAGGTYLDAVENSNEVLEETPLQLADGSMGRQIALLHDWLHGGHERLQPDAEEERGEAVEFRGETIEKSASEVLAFARERAEDDPEGASRFQAWYVQVGDKKVAPKWLVSELTDIPVSDFRTAGARRVLDRIGIDVQRAQ
jgi:hypothetical protein